MADGITDSSTDVVTGHGPDNLTFRFVSRPVDQTIPFQAPDLPPHFVPRNELLMIKQLITSNPGALAPIILHGPSGSGKTALAAALAHDADVLNTFPDGVLWASLGENGDLQQAQSVWGTVLGNDLHHLPDRGGRAAALRTLLRDARCLLIVDDVTDIEQVRALNVGGPHCVRLITTDSEDSVAALKGRRFLINKMSESEAISLLTEWAGILPEIYLPQVKEIIKRLGHLSLALALVGAQARQGIAWDRLREVLRDDQGGMSSLDPDDPETRDNALGLVVNLVLSRLGGVQLRRSALLGVFSTGTSCPFSVEAAAACWQMSSKEAAPTLDLLVDSALLQRLPDGYYALHKELRHHLRRASTANALEEAEERIRQYYMALVESSTEELDMQIGQIMAVFRQVSEQDQEMAKVFADALGRYFERRGLWANLVQLATSIVENARETDDLLREHIYLDDLGYAHTVLGHLENAHRCFERSLEVSQELGDPVGEASALNNIGAIYEREGDYLEAENYYRQSLSIRQQLGSHEDIADTLNNIAGVLYWQSRFDEALTTFQRVLDMYTVSNNRRNQAQTWLNIGTAYERLDNDQQALHAYQQSLAIYTNLGDQPGQAQALNNLGIVFFSQGNVDRALSHFKRSLAVKEQLGDRVGQASTLNNIALLYERTDALRLALDHYEQSYQILSSLDDPRAEVVRENISMLREKMDH